MTTTNDYIDVIDKRGVRVRRHGILQDGDRTTIRMTLMDNGDPALMAAIAEAQAARRIEQFDALHAGHRPSVAVMTDAATAERERLRDARNAKLSNAWRNPPPVVDQVTPHHAPPTKTTLTHDELIAARDRRLEAAWKR
ncbi:hypothetical protein [Bradyrhizobium viridifuturi]|uniref:hypothetical protein n=1 Tax=Bradyrhizobium viridifuturi TaxID=1654716 RepID=UPI00067EFEFF|nr:hypothetical protein [Bradyrhizobium viridifuturi]